MALLVLRMEADVQPAFGAGDRVRAKYHGQLGVVVKVFHDAGDGYAKGSVQVLFDGI